MPALPATARYLRDYVAIPSVNPMRRPDPDPELVGERRYAEHLRAQLRRLGLDAELVGDPERPSVVALASARGARETLVIASHLDTVPVDGMEIDPFDPRVEAGRLYGRGACDTKSGMASAVAALERVLARGALARNVALVGEADEELGSRGIRDVLAHLGPQRASWLIATEPTGLRAVTRHKGIVHALLRARGSAGHAAEPWRGRNALVALARALLAVDELARALERRCDPRLGPATLSPGVIGGGHAPNIVPDDAWLIVDRRLLPGEDEHGARTELEQALAAAGVPEVAVEWCRLEKPPLLTPDDHPCARALQAALAAHGLPTALDVAAFGTDAGVASQLGLPGAVFGPGSIAQAHTASEWVELAQVDAAARVFEHLLEQPDP
jgi:acetylornithine deacetylase